MIFPQPSQTGYTSQISNYEQNGKNNSISNMQLYDKYYNNTIVDTEMVVCPQDDYRTNPSFLDTSFQNQLGPSLNQSIVLFNYSPANQGTIYYGDIDSQTCSNLKAFVKEPSEKHCCLTMLNLLVYFMAITIVVLIITIKFYPYVAIQFVGIPYVIYFFIGCCGSPFGQYSNNMKDYSSLEKVYQQLQRRTGHLKFVAECYHFTGGKHRRKVISHSAVQIIPVRDCRDASENLANLKENNKYIFCKINKYYCFQDQNSHSFFLNAFNAFKVSNNFDNYQQYYHSLDMTIPDFASEIGLSVGGSGSCLKPMYIVSLLLGVGCFYLRYVECVTQRYSVNIIKRLAI